MGLLSELARDTEAWALGLIRAGQASIALMAEVRERYGADWEIEELTRGIIFEENQLIEGLRREAEGAREDHKPAAV